MPTVDRADLTSQVTIDRSSPIPIYFQLARQIEEAIESGRVTPGMWIDNELALAKGLGMSRPTVRVAMDYLVDKGLIVRRRGIGTRVVSPTVRRSLELSSLFDDLAHSGQQPTTEIQTLAREPADAETAAALEIAQGDPVLTIVRLRSATGQPIAQLTNHLPPDTLSPTREDLTGQGLYQMFRAAGITLHSAVQVIGARTASVTEARMLKERRSAALLTMQRITRDDHGRVVEFGNHIYAASRYNFELNVLSV